MLEQLIAFIESLKGNPKVKMSSFFDEASTKQAIILPILHLLGWNTYNIEEVTPEFSVENRRVDYSLRLNNSNEFFIEVKKTGEDLKNYQEQLLGYSFRQGVELATLTNGITWWFYLPTKKGDWKARKFYTIDIIQQESNDVASKFVDLISKDNVQSGKAVQHAKSIYEERVRKEAIENTLPEAWNKIITEPDTLLIDLIAETTGKLCKFKPDNEEVKRFLGSHEAEFLISPEPPKPEPPVPPVKEIPQFARRLIEDMEKLDKAVVIKWKQASQVVKLRDPGGSRQNLTLFVVTKGDKVYPFCLPGQLRKLGLPEQIAIDFVKNSARLFEHCEVHHKHPSRWSRLVTLKELQEQYDNFVSLVQTTIDRIKDASDKMG